MRDGRICAIVAAASPRNSGGEQALLRAIEAAVRAAGWTPYPIGQIPWPGDPLAEGLALCDAAIIPAEALGDPRSAYALGVRAGLRPGTCIAVAGEGEQLPAGVISLPIAQTAGGALADPAGFAASIESALRSLPPTLHTAAEVLIRSEEASDVPHAKTDRFRTDAAYDPEVKERLAAARAAGAAAVRAEHGRLRPVDARGAGVGVDLLLSYRAAEAWEDMIRLVAELAPPVRTLVLVREQHAFALNRAGRRDEAEAMLQSIIADGRADAETYALLGRCRKDRWEDAGGLGEARAAPLLDTAIEAYLTGFEADWRDAYPGINAVTLMELRDPPDDRRHGLIPVVRYAVERRIARTGGDYWDRASLVELAVLACDTDRARNALRQALAAVREPWEPKTTARNLGLIRAAWQRRGADAGAVAELEAALEAAADGAAV